MRYTTYGKTGKRVSVVGFGGMHFDTDLPPEKNAELVLYAWDKGINYFDTAPGYCSDQSEDIFGVALRQMKGEFFVSTKAMPTTYDTAEKAREVVLRSLERLGVPKIDFYHVWCLRKMEHYHLAMKPGGQYEGLLRCQEEGLIDHIVCSTHQAGPEVAEILSRDEFEGVLLGVNILNFPYRWDGVMAAFEKGYGVVAMNPLAGGAIPRHEAEFAFLAREGETPTEAALRFLIGAQPITMALNGFSATEHIDTACRVAAGADPMDEEEIARIRTMLGKNLDEICTGCGYCRDCPEGIPIPAYMQVYNERVMFGKDDEAMRRLVDSQHNWGILVERPAEAGDCTACGRCEEACTQHLPIIERLRDMARWETPEP